MIEPMRFRWSSKNSELAARERLPFESSQRRLVHPVAILKVDGRLDRHTLLGYAETMSRRGMMIGTISPKEMGSWHEVEFALPGPGDAVVRCSCRVAWTRPFSVDPHRPGMGLEFVDLPRSAAEAIDALWKDGRSPQEPASRTWSEFDHEWIPWAPRVASRKDLSG